jgi:hypothetical protein
MPFYIPEGRQKPNKLQRRPSSGSTLKHKKVGGRVLIFANQLGAE